MGRIIIAVALTFTLLFLGGCRCCPQDGQRPVTDSACRCGFQCGWPLERGNVDQGEIQLTPQLNKAVGCPGFTDGYSYTKLPFVCDTRYDK